MRKIRKRVFAAALAAALLFNMPGMSSAAAAETEQAEAVSESGVVWAEDDAAETEAIQEPEAEDSETDAQEPAEEETVSAQKEDTEQGQPDLSLCQELQEQLDAVNVPAPIDEPTEGAVAKVETSDGTIVYLDDSDFAKAFDTYYNYNNVTVTLLSDIQPGSIDMDGVQARVHIFNTCTLDLAGYTITDSDTAIYVWPSGNLTIKDSSSGKTGQVVSTGDAAILTQTGMVSLTGGTYTGDPTIDGKALSTNVSSLLENYGTQATPHYAYFDAQGDPIVLEENQRELTGTVTVAECKHIASVCEYQPLDDGISHTKTCLACGMTWDAESHTLGADNKCAQCEAELVAQVNDACYSDIKVAWGAACEADAATLTLLRDVETSEMLYVNSGDITFDGGNYTLKSTNPASAVNVSGGTLTVVSGTISGGYVCVNITDGALVVKGGKIETSDYEGINVAGGTAIISGGEVRGSSVGVNRGRNTELIISGGTFYSLSNGITVNVIGGKVGEVLLNYSDASAEAHYAFYRDGKPYKLPDGGTLPGGTFTVQQCKEPHAYTHTPGTTKHTPSCQYCGAGNGETDCIFTWTDNTGECVCGATLVVDVSDTDLIYDGIAKVPGVTVTLDGTELTAGYTVICSNNTNAGNNTASVTVSDTNWRYTQKFAIQKAPLTITASDQTITYGGSITQDVDNVTVAGLCSGDRLDGITLAASTANVPGGNITPSAAGIRNSGGRDVTGNYEITYKDGGLTINKADAEITVGTNTYNKTFGDAAFTLDVTDNNTEADVQYEVTAGADVVSVSNGTVTIKNEGTATITVSLPETANYNAAGDKTITVTVAKKDGYKVAEMSRSYLYSRKNTGSIGLAALLPKDCGIITYGTPAASGDVTYSVAPAVNDGKLSYTLNSGEINDEGTITVTVATRNYTDITITVKIKLTDRIPVELKDGTEVTLINNTITYGEALSELLFNEAEFVGDDGEAVAGTLAWKDAAVIPNAGTASAVWVFTPADKAYMSVEGTTAITVNKAQNAPNMPDSAMSVSNNIEKVSCVPLPEGWEWQASDKDTALEAGGAISAVAVYTGADKGNYENETVTVIITRADYEHVTGISLTPTSLSLEVGEQQELTAVVTPENANDKSVTWKSSNNAVATVEDGVVTAVNVGTARITVTTVSGGYTADCDVTVEAAEVKSYTVKFETNGGTQINDISVTEGEKVTKPTDPVREEHTFGGWYIDAECKTEWDFANSTVTSDMTLYAKWIENDKEEDFYSVYEDQQRTDLSDCKIASVKSKVYDGKAYTPTPKVTLTVSGKDKKLVYGTDYRLEYSNNVNAGTGTVTVVGIGNYRGRKTQDFTITKKSMKKLKTVVSSVAVGDSSASPIELYDGTKQLQKGVDYDYQLTASDVGSKGNVRIEVSSLQDSNYSGTMTVKVPVIDTDGKILIHNSDISLDVTEYEYDGKAHKPNVTVTAGGLVLNMNKDYTVTYKNNKDAGTAYVIVKGKGKTYTGSAAAFFTIKPAGTESTGFDSVIVNKGKAVTYNGKLQKPSVVVKNGGKKLSVKKDYVIEYTNNLIAGTGYVRITGINNYEGLTSTVQFIINPIAIKKASIKAKTSTDYTLKFKGRELIKGVDYEVSVSEPLNNGKVDISFTGMKNFNSSVIKKNVKQGASE